MNTESANIDRTAIETSTYVIGIATFKRPDGLRRTLESLARLDTDLPIRILVVENDVDCKEGLAVVESIKNDYRWPVQVAMAVERGISQARNALFMTAFEEKSTTALVMLDDDQWIKPNWLDELVAIQKQTNADVVGGWTVPDFTCPEPPWTAGLYIYYRPKRPDGDCDLIYGTGGVLIQRSVVSLTSAPAFDPSFSSTGGGDTEFFTRIKKRGAKFGFASKAVAYEVMDSKRASFKWACIRAFRIGAGESRIASLYETKSFVYKRRFSAVAAVFVAIAKSPFVLFFDNAKKQNSLLLQRNLGRLSTIFGYRYHEYKQNAN